VTQDALVPTSTELLYGFVDWLADDGNRVYQIGGAARHGKIHLALAMYCEANNLPRLRGSWLDIVKKPKHIS